MIAESDRENGSAVVEMVILTPVFIVTLLFIIALGRFAEARADVDGAARDAARAASLRRDPGAAVAEGARVAEATLATRGVACARTSVDVDPGGLEPGGLVAVNVTCDVRLADLTLLGLPGSRTIESRFVAPIDTFRSHAAGSSP